MKITSVIATKIEYPKVNIKQYKTKWAQCKRKKLNAKQRQAIRDILQDPESVDMLKKDGLTIQGAKKNILQLLITCPQLIFVIY